MIYLYDGSKHREWITMLGAYTEVQWHHETDMKSCGFFAGEDEVKGPGIVIVHPHPGSDVINLMIQYAVNHNLIIILIGGGGYSSSPIQLSEEHGLHFYARKAPVGNCDMAFGLCLGRFMKDFVRTKNPNFNLLEPDAWPQDLVAAALLLASLQYSKRPDNILEEFKKEVDQEFSKFWSAVKSEFIERGGNAQNWLDEIESAGKEDQEKLFNAIRECLPSPLQKT